MSSKSPPPSELLSSKAYVPDKNKQRHKRITKSRSQDLLEQFRAGNISLTNNSMSYMQYSDLSGGPRQAPSPNMNHVNGVNGNAAVHPGMVSQAGPVPAGHQQDLNMINTMLEEYAHIMEENRLSTARILEATGRVRERAMEKDLTNDEFIDSIAKEMNASTKNLEVEVADLSRKLEKANFEAKEYLDICFAYAKSMGKMLEQVHAFKLKTTEDMCAWHRSYRQQLELERRTNLELRNTIADMQAAAGRGQAALRNFRREWDGTPAYFETMAKNVELRQLCRTWKRMALSELPDDDSEFSDDDDLIDPEEKKRVAKMEMERIRAKKEANEVAAAEEAAMVSGMADTKFE